MESSDIFLIFLLSITHFLCWRPTKSFRPRLKFRWNILFVVHSINHPRKMSLTFEQFLRIKCTRSTQIHAYYLRYSQCHYERNTQIHSVTFHIQEIVFTHAHLIIYNWLLSYIKAVQLILGIFKRAGIRSR